MIADSVRISALSNVMLCSTPEFLSFKTFEPAACRTAANVFASLCRSTISDFGPFVSFNAEAPGNCEVATTKNTAAVAEASITLLNNVTPP